MPATSAAVEPSFNDMIVASDIIDTIRNDDRMIDFELGSDDRKKALIQALIEQKKKEGIVITEKMATDAVSRMNDNRYVFTPIKSFSGRLAATVFVRRNRYLRNSAIAGVAIVGVLVAADVGYDQLVVKPQLARQAKVIADQKAATESLDRDLLAAKGMIEPKYGQAITSLAQMSNIPGFSADPVKTEIEGDKASALAGIAARNLSAAMDGVQGLTAVKQRLDQQWQRATLQKDVSSFLDRAKAQQAAYQASGSAIDSGAAATLSAKLQAVSYPVETGDRAAVLKAESVYNDLWQYVSNDYDIRIVDRPGVRSGVFMTRHNQTNYYIIVEAVVSHGTATAKVEVKSSINGGAVATVPYWGVRVPQSFFNRVGEDKKSDGILNNVDAGFKPKGGLSIQWHMPTVNAELINSW